MGLRPEHLQAALLVHGNDFLRSLTKLTNHLLAGKAPSEVQAHFAGARLCALSKGENDVRPIAAGETLRRLASKAVCNAIRPKASELFEGKQYGVAAPAGAERVIHMCRLAMSSNMENPNFVMCKVDLRNAFNNVSRAAFLPLVQEYFPELFPWINWCYSDPSSLTYGARFISSEEGVQQGDPLGPLLFSLVALELSEAINLQTDIPAQLWYLDDGVLVGQAQEVRDALDTIARVGPQWDLYLNTSKCEIITSPSSAHQADYFPDIPDEKINSQGNFDILGSPVGSADHCSAYLLSHALEPAEDTLDAITNIQDPQVALALIRQCAGFCQMVYAMRSTPPQSLIHLCSRLDDFLMTAIEAIICPLDRSAQSQAQRLKRHGGLGLRSAALHASAAYVASVAFATDSWDPTDAEGFSEAILDINQKAGTALLDPRGRVLTTPNAPCEKALSAPYSYRKRRRPPPGNDPHPPDEPPGHILRTTSRTANTPTDAYPLSTPLYGSEECQDMLPPQWPKGKIPRQRVISYAIAAHAFSQEYETTDARTRARWISQCGTGASSWAFVTPSKDLGHAFTPTQFRTLARWWLGVDIYHEDSTCPMPKCSLPLDSKGDHALSCKHGHGIVTRHNAVTDQFADVCSRARLAPQREKSLGNRGPGGALTRPGDIYLPSLFLGNPIVLDFAVTHAQQLKYTDKVRNASWVAAGSFAEHYSSMEKGKQRREAVEAGCDFTAMVVESYGAWSPSASAVLRKVGERCSHASGGLRTESLYPTDLKPETVIKTQRASLIGHLVRHPTPFTTAVLWRTNDEASKPTLSERCAHELHSDVTEILQLGQDRPTWRKKLEKLQVELEPRPSYTKSCSPAWEKSIKKILENKGYQTLQYVEESSTPFPISDSETHLYTDGSLIPGTKKQLQGCGIVIIRNNERTLFYGTRPPEKFCDSIQSIEAYAVVEAISLASNYEGDVILHTDSEYIWDFFHETVHRYRLIGFHSFKGCEAMRSLQNAYYSTKHTKRFYCIKVKSHNENMYNDTADYLAKKACKLEGNELAIKYYGDILHGNAKRKSEQNNTSRCLKTQRTRKGTNQRAVPVSTGPPLSENSNDSRSTKQPKRSIRINEKRTKSPIRKASLHKKTKGINLISSPPQITNSNVSIEVKRNKPQMKRLKDTSLDLSSSQTKSEPEKEKESQKRVKRTSKKKPCFTAKGKDKSIIDVKKHGNKREN